MHNCVHNQVESMHKRYLRDTPDVQPKNLNFHLIMRIVKYLAAKVKEVYNPAFNFHQYVASKPGSSRRRFLKAYNQLLRGTNDLKKISKITAFVKNERYFEEGKAPRMIMGRDPRFNIKYARFIARFEDAFFQLPQVANCCDFWSCGEKFRQLYEKVSTRFFENDFSKYESSQRRFVLMIEFLVYAFTTPEDEIDDLLILFAVKCVKSGHTEAGLEFFFLWCRGSGDLDTSCGNGIPNYVATMYFKIMNFCPRRSECIMDGSCCAFDKFVIKGDDSYGTIPEDHRAELLNTYSYFGFDAKLIVREDGRTTEFCSGNFVRMRDGRFLYVQKLKKLITSLSTVINPDVNRHGWHAHYYRSLGDMYKQLYGDLPIYGDIADFLRTSSDKLKININLVNESYGANEAFSQKPRSVQKIDVCPETLVDISMNNDMSFSELEAISKYFRSNKLVFPAHMSKRCNWKFSKADAMQPLDQDVTSVKCTNIGKYAEVIAKDLRVLLRDPDKMLPISAAQSTDAGLRLVQPRRA
nr:RNA-dependent RNA polymerase [Tolivirales sp.]WRQ65715.1 RNA-dependent RNA polymerase [Tolivirales sp.]